LGKIDILEKLKRIVAGKARYTQDLRVCARYHAAVSVSYGRRGARNSQDQFVAALRKINCDYTLRGISHFTRRGHLKVASGRERRENVS
jgi:hypothetical protein